VSGLGWEKEQSEHTFRSLDHLVIMANPFLEVLEVLHELRQCLAQLWVVWLQLELCPDNFDLLAASRLFASHRGGPSQHGVVAVACVCTLVSKDSRSIAQLSQAPTG
jgi:hypothetical protein